MAKQSIYGSVNFLEQIQHFKDKVKLDSDTFAQLTAEAHAKAFMVEGVKNLSVLEDIFTSMDKAITNGLTYRQFVKDVLPNLEGRWHPKAGVKNRLHTIYETNLRQSYNAGRWKQIQAVKATRPYLRYQHSGSRNPRHDHLAWSGIVLPADDPWWNTHYPQNGWGCKCRVFTESEESLADKGQKVSPKAPPLKMVEKVNRKTGEIVKVPRGIDVGFDTNVGRDAYGLHIHKAQRARLEAEGKRGWKPLLKGNHQSYGLPESLPIHQATLLPQARTEAELLQSIQQAGFATRALGIEKIGGTNLPIQIHPEELAKHLKGDLGRSRFVGELPGLIFQPDEVWLQLERSELTGQARLMVRALRGITYEEGGKRKSLLLVVQAHKGQWVDWTFIPSDAGRINAKRTGRLLYAKKK